MKGSLRQINQHRIVTLKHSCQGGCRGEPSGMTAHDFNDGDGRFVVIDGCVDGNLADGRSYILGGASKARGVICHYQVIIDGLWDSDKADRAFMLRGVAGELADCVHRVITSDIKDGLDFVLFKSGEKFRIHRIRQILRKLIAAGSKVSPRGRLYKRKGFRLFISVCMSIICPCRNPSIPFTMP